MFWRWAENSQVTFNGIDWRKDAKHARKMYDAFPVMHQLHEMLWYLNEAILFTGDAANS